jgi:hypothetical protein
VIRSRRLAFLAARPRPSRWRAYLAAVVILATVVLVTLSSRGLAYVNLDSLRDEPVSFSLFVLLPIALTLVLLLAFLPPVLSGNVAILVGLIALLEAGAWALTPRPPRLHGEVEAQGTPSFYVPDPALGYAQAPSVVARHRRFVGDTPIYDVTYETDEHGRRRTPVSGDTPRTSFLLFFGDSNTFGEGLAQTETLPYYAGTLAPTFRPYNYGVSGYGPSHVLALARRRRIAREVGERDGYAVFFLIPAHIARVVGSSRVSTTWGRHFPSYELSAEGRLVDRGDFVHGRPLVTLAYFFWGQSNLAAYFGVDLPPRYTTRHYELMAKILGESRRVLAEQLRLRGFFVILGQAYNAAQVRVIHQAREALTREGVTCLDYVGLFDVGDARFHLSEFDYHNSAAANRLIASRLIADVSARP